MQLRPVGSGDVGQCGPRGSYGGARGLSNGRRADTYSDECSKHSIPVPNHEGGSRKIPL